jgi:hypothetical protein
LHKDIRSAPFSVPAWDCLLDDGSKMVFKEVVGRIAICFSYKGSPVWSIHSDGGKRAGLASIIYPIFVNIKLHASLG